MNDNFDWGENESVVIIHEQPTTAVYLNPNGQIVIRQQQYPEEDSYVVISPDFVGLLTRAIMDAADFAPDEAPAPSTSAQRSRRYRHRKRDGSGVTVCDAERDVTRDAGRDAERDTASLFSRMPPAQAAE